MSKAALWFLAIGMGVGAYYFSAAGLTTLPIGAGAAPYSGGTATRSLYGINPSLARWYNDPAKDSAWERQMLQQIKAACGTLLRTGLDWAQIEPNAPTAGQHTYHWENFDNIIDTAKGLGIAIIGLLVTTPAWANGDHPASEVHLWPPTAQHQADYVAFLTALVSRYRGKINLYEFWNEANGCGWHPGYPICGGSAPSMGQSSLSPGPLYLSRPRLPPGTRLAFDPARAAEYVPWLKVTYETIKSLDGTALVSTTGLDLTDRNYLQYLEYLYLTSTGENSCHGKPCWDAVAAHPYNDFGPVDFGKLDAVHQKMIAHGEGHKPVWITEYGWSLVDLKAAYLQESLATLVTPAYDYITLASYLIIADVPAAYGYGLTGQDLQPKSVYQTFAAQACAAACYDVTADQQIDGADVQAIAAAWRSTGAKELLRYDVSRDGRIGIADLMRVAAHLGQACPG